MLMPLFCMELMDTVVLATPDMAMVPTPMEDMPMVATPMPMELTTERGLLMLSPRLMPMLLFCMELMDMVVLATPDMAMVPTPMELTTERGLLMPIPRLMLMLTMELTAMALAMLVLAMPDTAMVPTPMEDMPMVATPTPTELMLTESKLLSQSLVVKLLQTKAQK